MIFQVHVHLHFGVLSLLLRCKCNVYLCTLLSNKEQHIVLQFVRLCWNSEGAVLEVCFLVAMAVFDQVVHWLSHLTIKGLQIYTLS